MTDNSAIVLNVVAGIAALLGIWGVHWDPATQQALATSAVAIFGAGNMLLHHLTKGK